MSYKPLTKDNVKEFKNFKYKEFKCHCGGKYCNGYPVAFSYDLAKNLQNIRSHFGKAVHITSPIRCERWNVIQNGKSYSKHKKGWACDFYIKGVSYNTLANYVKKLPYFNYCYKIKPNQNLIHFDIIPPEYEEKYNLTRILKKGCKGNDIKELQRTLGGLAVDGIFGENTKKKVKSFQKTKKLIQDGKVGEKTAHALDWLYRGK